MQIFQQLNTLPNSTGAPITKTIVAVVLLGLSMTLCIAQPSVTADRPDSSVQAQNKLSNLWLKYAAVGELKKLKELHKVGMDIAHTDEVFGANIMHHAAANGHTKVISWAIDEGMSINQVDNSGFTPLQWAAYQGQQQTVAWMLKQPPLVVNLTQDNPVLIFAMQSGSIKLVKSLLNYELKLLGTSFQGVTTQQAAEFLNQPAIQTLINAGKGCCDE